MSTIPPGCRSQRAIEVKPIRTALYCRQERDLDLVRKEIGAGYDKRIPAEKFVRTQVLDIAPLLQSRVVLLNLVAENRIIQEEREIGEEVKQRPAYKAVDL